MNLLKNSLNFGTISGIAIMLLSLLFYTIGLTNNFFVNLIIYAVHITLIVVGTIYLRKHFLNNQISYGQSFASGVLITLFMSILLAFYIYIFFKIIAPDEIEKILNIQEETLYKQGFDEEIIETHMQVIRKFTTPLSMALFTILGYVFWGTIISLIVAIFTKRKIQSYEQIMSEINNEINSEKNE